MLPEGTLAVQTRYLSDDAATLACVLLSCRDRPDRRSQLGTQASLDWAILRQGSSPGLVEPDTAGLPEQDPAARWR